MKYCSHCGKELSEGASQCPYCGEKLSAVAVSRRLSTPNMLFAGCSMLSIVSLFLGWVKISFFDMGNATFSPMSLMMHLNKLQTAFGEFLPEENAQTTTVVLVCGVVLIAVHVATIILTIKGKTAAYSAGMFSNLTMLLMSATVFYLGQKAQAYSFGLFAVTPVVPFVLFISVVGLVLFVRMFAEQLGTTGDAVGYILIGAAALISWLKGMGLF